MKMSTRVIAFANHKGGVGKTTTAAALGAILSRAGRNVLLCDLDAQANLTASLTMDEPTGYTIYNAFCGETEMPIMHLRENLDLAPSCLDMAGAEMEISGKMCRESILKKLLAPLRSKYDYILLDCPPSLGLITVNALVAANELIIPLTAEALPSRGLAKLTTILQEVRDSLNSEIKLTGILITRWESTNLSKGIEAELRQSFPNAVFSTKIRKNVSIAEAPLSGQDLFAYAPQSNGAADYTALAAEVMTKETITDNNQEQ